MMTPTLHRLILCLLMLVTTGALAHHSANLYFDMTKKTTLRGEVGAWKLQNPHSQILLHVTDAKGKRELWTVETHAPALMARMGWRRDTLKPGEQIEVSGFAARKPEVKAMYLDYIVKADGTKISPDAPIGGSPKNK